MKTTLHAVAFLAMFLFFQQLSAQCTLSQATVSNVQQSGCSFTFDLSFNLSGNNGNKITAVYIYSTSSYDALPTNFYGPSNNKVPSASSLNSAGALAVIKINTDSTLTVNNYQKEGQNFVRPTSMKPNLPYEVNAQGQITIKNIALAFANCNSMITLRADIISSQSPELSSVGCLSRGLSFSPNEPIVRALSKGCGQSRMLGVSFVTTQARTINFRIFKDVAPFGQFTAADTTATALSDWYQATTAANNGEFRAAGDYAYNLPAGDESSVWVVAYASGVPNVSLAFATNSCSLLPTVFRSVTAQRSNSLVELKWETATEENNKGFNVQRQTGSSAWQTVAFVATSAPNGNSSSPLLYAFTDKSSVRGVVQYRLQQVGVDGKITYSPVRVVRSEDLTEKTTVFPNPSFTGKITLAFDAASATRDITVSDISGRVVKRFQGVKDNSLVIENLTSGMYTIQIFNQSTSAVSMEKVIVKTR